MYGFEGEVKAKYSSLMVDLFTEVYNWLPLCHLLDNKVLVMHGGLFAKVRRLLVNIYKTTIFHVHCKFNLRCSSSDILHGVPSHLV